MTDGEKRFITNALIANLFVVFARTRPADSDGPGIAMFLVPADTPGVQVGGKNRKMGHAGSTTATVHFAYAATATEGDSAIGDFQLVQAMLATSRPA